MQVTFTQADLYKYVSGTAGPITSKAIEDAASSDEDLAATIYLLKRYCYVSTEDPKDSSAAETADSSMDLKYEEIKEAINYCSLRYANLIDEKTNNFRQILNGLYLKIAATIVVSVFLAEFIRILFFR